MRLLHERHDHDRDGVAWTDPASDRSGRARRARAKSLPLRKPRSGSCGSDARRGGGLRDDLHHWPFAFEQRRRSLRRLLAAAHGRRDSKGWPRVRRAVLADRDGTRDSGGNGSATRSVVSFLPDPLHVISKPAQPRGKPPAWRIRPRKQSRRSRPSPSSDPRLRLEHSSEFQLVRLTRRLLWLHTCVPLEEGARMTNTAGIPGDRICSFIERVERIDEEIKALNEGKKEVFAEAKGEGFDVKVVREILRLRKQDKDERDEQESLLDLYLRAMESAGSSQVRAA